MKYFFFFLLILLPLSCRKQAPQLPSNKGGEVDGQAVALLGINKTIANEEDSLLLRYVSTIDSVFEKNNAGFWYRIHKRGNGEPVQEKMLVTISYQVYLLDNNIISETTYQSVEIGKKQLPTGLEEGLKLMRKGESATFIVPWYIAYGMKGKGEIPPYTSVIFEVKLAN
ncbi:MAG: FKBP-type peptidyl-prolyl cis-trans isomerase [Prevotellaceae bacterium]|jgi:FKBP-type peptidyl-prolyl cis-trans isomerase|nr:FKBP-type peptidyl-prolyl cis-trans isomerase [Prevotellaceae bacterium]